MSLDANGMLADLAVDLLCRPDGAPARGAAAARERRLAGVFLHGLQQRETPADGLTVEIREGLRRAARAEEIQDAVAARETGAILSLVGNLAPPPVVLKGRLLGHQVWPRSCHRPSTDLDLLVEPEAVDPIVEALHAVGYATIPEPPHPEISSVVLRPPANGTLAVDLHWRPFRAVGRGIDPVRLLRRARPSVLDGLPCRTLDEPDRLLFLLVHAAKHGLRRTKWLLDLYGVALRADVETWRQALRRAIASHSARPFFAAASPVARLPGISLDAVAIRSARPSWPVRQLLSRVVSLDGAVHEEGMSPRQAYAFAMLLEERLLARLRRGLARRIALDRWGKAV